MNILKKNPFLAVKIQKKYSTFRILDIMIKIAICFKYCIMKPMIIKKEKKGFENFELEDNLLIIENGKSIFWLPNIMWEKNQIAGEYVQKKIYYYKDYYERNILDIIKAYALDKNVILDIGANIGNHTVYFAKECNAKKIYAFEPVSETYKILQKNISINCLDSTVELYNVGVGDVNSKAEITHFDEGNLGASMLTVNANGNIEIISIDKMEFVDKIDFVKIDVEGGEYNVIQGMTNKLLSDRPHIFVEIWDENFKKVNMLLSQMGYKIEFSLGENYLYTCSD